MTPKLLKEAAHIDLPAGFRCRFIESATEREVLHTHEYYEIFLTRTDNVIHCINGVTRQLQKGELVFVRPFDVHRYSHRAPYSFVNLAFSAKMAKDLFAFIGDDRITDGLLHAEFSPTVILTKQERTDLEACLMHLSLLPSEDSRQKNLAAKKILFSVFADYFSDSERVCASYVPRWLFSANAQMHAPANYAEGLTALQRISGKSYSYIAKCVRLFYGKSVTEYINDIRLEGAKAQLREGELSVMEISNACGFPSCNWFHKCFKRKYGQTPKAFRLASRR